MCLVYRYIQSVRAVDLTTTQLQSFNPEDLRHAVIKQSGQGVKNKRLHLSYATIRCPVAKIMFSSTLKLNYRIPATNSVRKELYSLL